MDWNVKEIIADFGGPEDLHAALEAHGHDVTVRAVRQWNRRGRIKSNWLLPIMKIRGVAVPPNWVLETKPEPEMEDIF